MNLEENLFCNQLQKEERGTEEQRNRGKDEKREQRKRGQNKITEESIKVMQQNTTTCSSKQQLYRVAESGC